MRRFLGAAVVCLGIIAAVALGDACYTIPSPDCGFLCGAGSSCPDNYTCATDSVCHRNGTPTSLTCSGGDGGMAGPDSSIQSPRVIAETPSDGATGVASDATITATFDQPLITTTVDDMTFLATAGSASAAIVGIVSYEPSASTASFQAIDSLPSGALIQVQLTANIASTQSAPLVPASWSFTTIDNVAPTLASSVPLDMSANVADASTITVTFSEPVADVDTTSFTVAAPGPAPIAGTIAPSGTSGATYVFTPTAALPSGMLIAVTLSGAIHDLASNALAPVAFSFTTM